MCVKSEESVKYGSDNPKYVYFAHGKESGPWGDKIRALADVAKQHGYQVESPDYSDLIDANKRAERLITLCTGKQVDVLVGSSMGGYVSAVTSAVLQPKGLFLMAPAFFIPGYAIEEPQTGTVKTVIVHGWNDDIVPVENSIRFAQSRKAELHLLDSGHRLNDQIDMLCLLFNGFLNTLQGNQLFRP